MLETLKKNKNIKFILLIIITIIIILFILPIINLIIDILKDGGRIIGTYIRKFVC